MADGFSAAPAAEAERTALRRSPGLCGGRFLAVVTGAEGSGGLYRRAAAVLRHGGNVEVAVICGRNRRQRHRRPARSWPAEYRISA